MAEAGETETAIAAAKETKAIVAIAIAFMLNLLI
jgi:hypothetical protein